jgi:hypothetical protein
MERLRDLKTKPDYRCRNNNHPWADSSGIHFIPINSYFAGKNHTGN